MSSDRQIRISADYLNRLETRNHTLYRENYNLRGELKELRTELDTIKNKKNIWQKFLAIFNF